MNEPVVFSAVGGLLAAGYRAAKISRAHGGFRQAWKHARKDLFVKSGIDGAIGAGAGCALGVAVKENRLAASQASFIRHWGQVFGDVPENLKDFGTFEGLVESVAYVPNEHLQKPVFPGLSRKFFITPLDKASVPIKDRKFLIKFSPSQFEQPEKPPEFITAWSSLPNVITGALAEHHLDYRHASHSWWQELWNTVFKAY